jgi:hypothetical protein
VAELRQNTLREQAALRPPSGGRGGSEIRRGCLSAGGRWAFSARAGCDFKRLDPVARIFSAVEGDRPLWGSRSGAAAAVGVGGVGAGIVRAGLWGGRGCGRGRPAPRRGVRRGQGVMRRCWGGQSRRREGPRRRGIVVTYCDRAGYLAALSAPQGKAGFQRPRETCTDGGRAVSSVRGGTSWSGHGSAC